MTSMALAATLFGPEDLRMVERPLDPLAAGMVRIRFGAGGICGSDLHYYRHARTGDFVVTSPLVLGHEIAGEVIEIAGDAPGLKTGDRIAVNPSRWCGHCSPCREGRLNLCENIFFMGSASKTPHMQGGFASQFDAIPAQCVKIPDHLSYQAAALAEPLAVCLHAVARAGEVSIFHSFLLMPSEKLFGLNEGIDGIARMSPLVTSSTTTERIGHRSAVPQIRAGRHRS